MADDMMPSSENVMVLDEPMNAPSQMDENTVSLVDFALADPCYVTPLDLPDQSPPWIGIQTPTGMRVCPWKFVTWVDESATPPTTVTKSINSPEIQGFVAMNGLAAARRAEAMKNFAWITRILAPHLETSPPQI